MVGMILVDCSGDSPPWVLDHVEWNGLSTADLIFPSFVFIMGMAVPLAMSANRPFKLKNLLIKSKTGITCYSIVLGKSISVNCASKNLCCSYIGWKAHIILFSAHLSYVPL